MPSNPGDGAGYARWWSQELRKWLTERNYSERTESLRSEYLSQFAAWCEARGLYYPQEITRPIVERYRSTLYVYRKVDGKPLAFRAQHSRLSSVRMLFRWLSRQHVIVSNPASEIELPKLPRSLPRHALTELEVEPVLRLPNVDEVMGLRDRAMLEVLYATAVRRAELCRLRIFDVDAGGERCT